MLIFVNMMLPANRARCQIWSKFLKVYAIDSNSNDYIFAFGNQNWRTYSGLSTSKLIHAAKNRDYQKILDYDEVIYVDESRFEIDCPSTFSV